MSIEKELKTIHIQKHDTEENWIKAGNNSNFTPKAGQIIVYDVDDKHSKSRTKIGDGKTNINDLPFTSVGELTADGGEVFNLYEDITTNLGSIGGIQIGEQTLLKNEAGQYAHAEGVSTKALGKGSHTEGVGTTTESEAAHAEGIGVSAIGTASHAEGRGLTFTVKVDSISDNVVTVKSNSTSLTTRVSELEAIKKNAIIWFESDITNHTGEFYYVTAVELQKTLGIVSSCKITLDKTPAFEKNANLTVVMGGALSYASHIEGNFSNAVDLTATSFVNTDESDNQRQHAEGNRTLSAGLGSHAEGEYSKALSHRAHAEGYDTTASGNQAHAEGAETVASGNSSHAEGYKTQAKGNYSHSEGNSSVANAEGSHAGGYATVTGENAINSFAHGDRVEATKYKNEVAFGLGNLEEDEAIFMIGNGYWDNLPEGGTGIVRKNAFVVKSSNPNKTSYWTPKAWAEVESQGTTDKSVVIKKTLDDKVTELKTMFSGGIKKEVVSELPTTGKDDIIYMVGPIVDTDGEQYYEEYMFLDGVAEVIGSTRVDLSSKMDKFGEYDPEEWKLYLTNKNDSVPPFTIYNGNQLTIESQLGINLKTEQKIGLSGAYTEIEGTHLSLQGRGNTDGNGMPIMGVSTPITEEDIEHYPQYGFMSTGQVPYQAANKKYVDENVAMVENRVEEVANNYVNNSANSIKSTVKNAGSVTIRDISPIEHNVDVVLERKSENNLITQYLSCAFGDSVLINGVTYSVNANGVITASGTPIAMQEMPFHICGNPMVYGQDKVISLEPGTTYEFKGLNQPGSMKAQRIYLGIWDNGYTVADFYDYGEGVIFTVPENNHVYYLTCYIEISEQLGTFEGLIFNPTLYKMEKLANTIITVSDGTTETEYTTNDNGVAEVSSIYPTMTISTDASGATIKCGYNKDTNAAIEELNNKIINNNSVKESILLKDTATGETYKLCITNGKLNMEVVK